MILGKIKTFFLNLYDRITSETVYCSIGDIYLKRAELDHCQFLLTTRKMDIQDYCSGVDKSFPRQNLISRIAYGNKHKEEQGNREFSELIASFKKSGYTETLLTVDKDCRLMDGNHRMGMSLYMKIDTIKVRFLKRRSPFLTNIDGFLTKKIDTSFLLSVKNEYDQILDWLVSSGNTFCCVLEGNYKNDSVSLLDDLMLMTNVLKVDSKEGKVLCQFSLPQPLYTINNHELVSKRCVQIFRVLNKRKLLFDLDVNIIMAFNCLQGKNIKDKYCK